MRAKLSKKLFALLISLIMVLSAFGMQISAYATTAEDQAAADVVINMVNKIPDTITFSDCTNISDARRYYTSLTSAQQALVTNYNKLTAAEPVAFKFPGQITTTVTQDPAHSMTFTWTTKDTTMTNPVVNVWKSSQPEATADSYVSLSASTRVIEAQAYSKYTTGKTNTYTATATGLTPNTTYSYRVGSNVYRSDICKFKTAPLVNSNFTFTMLADIQFPLGATGALAGNDTFAAIANKFPKSSFTYFAGDFTDLASQYEWNSFFGDGANQLFQKYMSIGVEGNHENTGYDGTTSSAHLDTNAVLFNEHFNFPSAIYNGKTLRNCYSFDYGPVHFMAINTNYSDGNAGAYNPTSGLKEMAAWLDADAAASKKPWKILLLHKQLYSGGTHAPMTDLTELRKALVPVINKNKIDAVLGGHDHTFARGFVDATGAKVNPTVLSQSSASNQLLSSPQGSASPTTTPGAIYTLESVTETVLKPDVPLYFMNGTAGGLKWYAQNPDYVKPTFKIAEGDPFTPNYSYLDRDSSASPAQNIQEQFYSVIDVTPYSLKFNTYVYNYTIDPTAANAILYDSITVLNYKTQIADAAKAVAKAEVTNLQTDVSSARALILALNSNDRIALNSKLNSVQKIINATNSVVNAEKYKTKGYVNSAQKLVNLLPKSSNRTTLQKRLDVVKKKFIKK